MFWFSRAGHADDPVHVAPRVHLREAPVDVQAVRPERRRVHNQVGARPDRVGHPRADGQAAASTYGWVGPSPSVLNRRRWRGPPFSPTAENGGRAKSSNVIQRCTGSADDPTAVGTRVPGLKCRWFEKRLETVFKRKENTVAKTLIANSATETENTETTLETLGLNL